MKVGLVLGAGGVLGGAWLTGALHAIARETGWDPGSADRIVGTSAGLGDRRLHRGRSPAVVHGRPLQRRDLRGPQRARRPPRRGRRPRRRRHLQAAPRPAADRPGFLAAGPVEHGAPDEEHPAGDDGGLDPARVHVHGVDRGVRAARRARRLGGPPELLGGGVRLRQRAPRALRPRGRAEGRRSAPPWRPPAPSPASTTRSRSRGRRYVDGGVRSASNLDLLAGRASTS